jgi:hypothetical protein
MDEDLGWAPVPPANLPWNDFNQLILFNLATSAGPALDTANIQNINVPTWVATVHAHPGIKAIIAIGGAGNNNWGIACNDTNRAQFVQNLIGFATSNHFDGVDLDIEDGPWMAIGPPNPAMTTCIIAISNAAHAAGLYVSADVITNWQGPWYAPSQSYVQQFNLMTFGDDLATMQADVAATINQGLPASKFVVGVDVDEHPQPPGGCGQFASYAAQAGLMGSFVWNAAGDARAGHACADGLAGSPPPPPPSSPFSTPVQQFSDPTPSVLCVSCFESFTSFTSFQLLRLPSPRFPLKILKSPTGDPHAANHPHRHRRRSPRTRRTAHRRPARARRQHPRNPHGQPPRTIRRHHAP